MITFWLFHYFQGLGWDVKRQPIDINQLIFRTETQSDKADGIEKHQSEEEFSLMQTYLTHNPISWFSTACCIWLFWVKTLKIKTKPSSTSISKVPWQDKSFRHDQWRLMSSNIGGSQSEGHGSFKELTFAHLGNLETSKELTFAHLRNLEIRTSITTPGGHSLNKPTCWFQKWWRKRSHLILHPGCQWSQSQRS